MKVYLVTSGSYSDYRVDAVFSTMERAESYKTGASETNGVEEYDLDPEEPPRLKEGESLFNVIMLEDGTVELCISRSRSVNQFVDLRWRVLHYRHQIDLLVLSCDLIAKDRDHAIKIANERRASLIASGNWKAGVSSDTFKDDA